MPYAISAFFSTRAAGEAARTALLREGFRLDQVSYLTSEAGAHDVTAVGPKFRPGAESEAASDAWIGGAVGLAAGLIAASLPGLGPLIAAGPLAAAIGGLSVGAAAGGIVGLLRDHGVPEEEAEFYEEGLRRGGSIVTVTDISDAEATVAREILDRSGASDIERLADEWKRSREV